MEAWSHNHWTSREVPDYVFKPFTDLFLILKDNWCEFPGGPVTKILHFHCWGCGFDSWVGKSDPAGHVVWSKKGEKNTGPLVMLLPYFQVLVKQALV